MRREITPRLEQKERVEEVDSASKKAETILNKHRRMIRDISEDTHRNVREINHGSEDNIYKRMVDIRLSPWRGEELDIEDKNNQDSRAKYRGWRGSWMRSPG